MGTTKSHLTYVGYLFPPKESYKESSADGDEELEHSTSRHKANKIEETPRSLNKKKNSNANEKLQEFAKKNFPNAIKIYCLRMLGTG